MPEATSQQGALKSRLGKLCLAFLSIALFLVFGTVLESLFGFPFYTTYRIACAGACVGLMAKIGQEYSGQRWPWVAVSVALATNIGLFFTPLFDRPASRGEVMVFALPDIAIFLAVRAATYPTADAHQRAVRQQLIVGVILAVAVSAIILATGLIPERGDRARVSVMRQAASHS
jgi:hypothetical protein